jgi:hypothetical protein
MIKTPIKESESTIKSYFENCIIYERLKVAYMYLFFCLRLFWHKSIHHIIALLAFQNCNRYWRITCILHKILCSMYILHILINCFFYTLTFQQMTDAILFRDIVCINDWNLIIVIIAAIQIIAILYFGAIWRVPIFGTIMFRFIGHHSVTGKLLNTEYK